MKIIFTGGHFSPAYSVIQKIRNKHEIVVIGRKHGLEGDESTTFEYEICKKHGIPFIDLKAGRLQRKFTIHTLKSFFKIPSGLINSLTILKEKKPDVVVTFGGYIALPVAIAAKILNIPVVLHEQTQKAGLAARIISNFSKVVLISFDSSRNYFNNKNLVLVGNPIRESIFNTTNNIDKISKPFIYVTGGSTGAHAINELVLQVLPDMLKNYSVVHQTGNAKQFDDFKRCLNLKNELKPEIAQKYFVSEFFYEDEVAYFLRNCELVISRAGVNSVLEIMAVGAVGLLIPLPHGQKNEQLENAILYQTIGLGKYIKQEEITKSNFITLINDIIENRQNYIVNRKNAAKYIHIDAVQKIIEQIEKYGARTEEGRNSSKK